MARGTIHVREPVENLSVSISSTGFTATVKSAKRCGHVVSISFDVSLTTAFNHGTSINFTISGLPAFDETYLRSNTVISGINQIAGFIGNPDDSSLQSSIRNLSTTANLASGTPLYSFNFTYIERT